ncbi:MAG: tetratricopeptide repeat protein [Byssovorax cruenta]
MQRSSLRVVGILMVLALAIFVPLVVSGYSEGKRAAAAQGYHEAAEHYRRAAQRLPWRADLYELSGHEYYYAKEYSQADAVYQKAFQRKALSPEGWVAWGDVVYLAGDTQRATKIWEQALGQKNPSENLYSRLSKVYKDNGEYAKATEYLQKYVGLHPQEAAAHYRLGLLLTLTDPNTALSELITASQLDPQLDSPVETLRSALNLASLDDTQSTRLVLAGRGLALVQEWDLARLAFESAVEADGKNAEAWAWLGESKQQAAEDGSAELKRAYDINPNSATVRGLRGLYFQRTGNFRQALTEFQTAALLDDKNPAWQVSIGETYSKLGDLIRALQAYQAATSLAPDDPSYWRLLDIFCAQNNVNVNDVGIPAAQKAVVLLKENAESLDLLGWLLLLGKRYEESEQMLLHALSVDPQNASAHLHLGLLYLERDKRDLAYPQLLNARDLGNTDAQVILNQYFP